MIKIKILSIIIDEGGSIFKVTNQFPEFLYFCASLNLEKWPLYMNLKKVVTGYLKEEAGCQDLL